jgi:hypothetical protein
VAITSRRSVPAIPGNTMDGSAKNRFSHPYGARQYLLLGGGEHYVVMNRTQRKGLGPTMAVGMGYDL